MEIERFIPEISNLNKYYGLFFSDFEKVELYTSEDYLTVVKKHEIEIEAYFNKLLENLGIQSTVKSERYSLPFTNEILHIQEGKMNLFQLFNLREFGRVVVLELLKKNIKKIRFYVTGDVILLRGKETKIVLKFRYKV